MACLGRYRRAQTRLVDGSGSSKHGQIIGGEVTEMNVLGTDTFQPGLGPLRCANGRKFGDKVVLTCLIQSLELGRIGMSQVMEIVRIRDEAFQAFTCKVRVN